MHFTDDEDLLEYISHSTETLYEWLSDALKDPHKDEETQDYYYLPNIITMAHDAVSILKAKDAYKHLAPDTSH